MTAPDSNDPIDIDELKEIMDDDLELIQECFDDFIKEWPGQYIDIKSAVLEKDAQKLDESAHKLKGTLRYLAAENAADAAYALEAAGKEKDLEGVEAKLKLLESQCKRVVAYIQQFKP